MIRPRGSPRGSFFGATGHPSPLFARPADLSTGTDSAVLLHNQKLIRSRESTQTRTAMGVITKNILTGLITLLPITLTVYLLYWLTTSTEQLLGEQLQMLLPEGIYRPGLGVAVGLALCFVVGMLMHTYVMQRLFAWGESLILQLPVIRSVYPTIRDFFEYFSPMRKKDFRQVVAVKLPESGLEVVGLVTQTDRHRMPKDLGGDDDCVL